MNNNQTAPSCPLCEAHKVLFYHQDQLREYLRCISCGLVFVPERFWLGKREERAVYDLHENHPLDEGYRKFLSRITTPLLEKLKPRQKGLDFGCGPGPVLPMVFEDHGHRMERYDPYYYRDASVLRKKYDFICATEVVEHLRDPKKEFDILFTMLKPGGWLGIMTKLVIDQQAFRRWHYIRDLTHICFYRKSTFEYLAKRFCATLEFVADDAILLHKSASGEKG